jgi:hypothetical protein
MLEILFLSWFVRKLAAIAKAKGRSGGWGEPVQPTARRVIDLKP